MSIQGTQEQDNELTGSLPAEEKRKIQSRDECFRTCNRRSTVSGTRWEMKTNSIFIKDDTTSGKKL